MEIIRASAASFMSAPIRSEKASARFFSTATAVLMRAPSREGTTRAARLRMPRPLSVAASPRPGVEFAGFRGFSAEVRDRRAVAAVGLIGLFETTDVRRPRQVLPHRAAEGAGAVSVDDPDRGVRVEHRAIELGIEADQRTRDAIADQIDLLRDRSRAFERIRGRDLVSAIASGPRRSRGSGRDPPELREWHVEADRAARDVCPVSTDLDHRAAE